MQLDNKTARPRNRARAKRLSAWCPKARRSARNRRGGGTAGRGDDAAVAHAFDELRHVVIERRVLLVERDALLQEADAGGEIVADQRFEPALERLQRGGLVELFERRPDGERIVGLRHREVQQAELQAREVQLGIDVERGAHLRHGFRIFAPLRELGAQQVAQFGVARVAHDGGTQTLQFWRIHESVRPKTGRLA